MSAQPTDTVLTTADGATLALTTQGSGPQLLIVPSVASSRTIDPQPDLATTLATFFTVTTYDRRGTGKSTLPPGSDPDCYTVDQEINDITLIAQHLGATVDVYGFSSGADLALLAAQAGAPIRTLYLLEPPLFEPPPEVPPPNTLPPEPICKLVLVFKKFSAKNFSSVKFTRKVLPRNSPDTS